MSEQHGTSEQSPYWPHDVGERWLRAEDELSKLKAALDTILSMAGYSKKEENDERT